MALQSAPSGEAIYMCFGSVAGEAKTALQIPTSPASGGWIALTSCSYGASVSRPQLTSAQVDFEGEAAPVKVTKQTDAASIGLLRQALMGGFDQPAVIVFVRTNQGAATEYMRIEMEQCGITDFAMAGGEDRQTESYEIRCSRMSITAWRFSGTTRGAQSVVTFLNEAGT